MSEATKMKEAHNLNAEIIRFCLFNIIYIAGKQSILCIPDYIVYQNNVV